MFRIFYVLALIPFCFVLSCGGEETSADLEISVSPTTAFLLPGDIILENDSCYDDESFSEFRLIFDSVSTSWSGEGSFTPVILLISIDKNGLNQTCTVAGRGTLSLGDMLGYSGDTLTNVDEDADGELDGVSADSICPMLCSELLSPGVDASFTTEVKLIGIQTLDDGTQVPISAKVNVKVESIDL